MPPLAGTARDVVLHAKAGKHFYLAVIHLHGNGDFQNSLRRAKNLAQAGIELEELSGHIELDLRDAERVQILARRHARSIGCGAALTTVAILPSS